MSQIMSVLMIKDQDIIQLFRYFSRIPLGLPDSEIRSKNKQLFKGIENTLGCDRHLQIFKRFNVIPKYCFDCYKVLITPRNVVEHFKLLMIFEKIQLPIDNIRKCMVEQRPYCSGTYKGYIYCKSIEECNEVRKIARKLISDEISPQVSVTIKRGCSEYELSYPAYAQMKPGSAIMHYKKDWQVHEDYFDNNFVGHKRPPDINDNIPYVSTDGLTTYTQAEVVCMQHWLRYAATIGDTSYLAITGMTLPPLANLKRPPFKNTIPFKKNN